MEWAPGLRGRRLLRSPLPSAVCLETALQMAPRSCRKYYLNVEKDHISLFGITNLDFIFSRAFPPPNPGKKM